MFEKPHRNKNTEDDLFEVYGFHIEREEDTCVTIEITGLNGGKVQ